MKKISWKKMRYDKSIDFWIFILDEETGYRMQCGEWFELYLGYGKILSYRLELGRDWCIITGQQEVSFYLKKMRHIR